MASTSHTLDGFSLRLELMIMVVLVLVLPAVVNVVLLWKYSLPGDDDVYRLADGVISAFGPFRFVLRHLFTGLGLF